VRKFRKFRQQQKVNNNNGRCALGDCLKNRRKVGQKPLVVDKMASKSEAKASSVDLKHLSAKVVRVHVDGIGRTKESLVMKNLASIFKVSNFEDLALETVEIQNRLLGEC